MSALSWLKVKQETKAPRRIPGERGPVLRTPEPLVAEPSLSAAPRAKARAARPEQARPATPRQAAQAPRPSRLRRRLKRGLVAGGVLLAGGLGVLAWQSDWLDSLPRTLNHELALALVDAGLTVQNVTVVGRRDTPQAAVLDALGVRRGDPILDVDPEQARVALEQLGWVKQARVRRALPNTLHIELVERRPVAIWQHQGVTRVIDRDGKVIGEHGERFRNQLPLVVGEDAPQETGKLMEILSGQPDLAKRVVASIRVGGRRWNLKLDNDVEVRLPADDPATPDSEPALAYAELARLDQHYGLLSRDVVGIDLRLPDRLVVQLSSGALQLRLANGKDT